MTAKLIVKTFKIIKVVHWIGFFILLILIPLPTFLAHCTLWTNAFTKYPEMNKMYGSSWNSYLDKKDPTLYKQMWDSQQQVYQIQAIGLMVSFAYLISGLLTLRHLEKKHIFPYSYS